MSGHLLYLGLLTIGSFFVFRRFREKRLPLPPGPTPELLTGNLHHVPTKEPWLVYAKWAEIHGPILSVNIFGKTTVVLNSPQAVMDLLESRATTYSDRPASIMFKQLAGRTHSLFSIAHNARHRFYRKIVHSCFNPRASREYHQLQIHERSTLLQALVATPSEYVEHMKTNSISVILKIVYGWTYEGPNDYFVSLLDRAIPIQLLLARPGRWLVDIIPALRYVPSWFPGASFKLEAEKYRKIYKDMDDIPFDWSKEQIASGNYEPSFISQLLQKEDDTVSPALYEDSIRYCSSGLYAGGADTTPSAMCTFVALMALYPSIQRRAQEEIDRVIGRDRLPNFEDESSFVYLAALIKEVLRWAPVAPLGLPHRVMSEDIYAGYRIPKGSVVVANIWAITHNKELYPDPMVFDPDRFLGSEPQIDPRKFVFGFGRRVCPGAHFAERSLFLNIAGVLSAFDITLPEGAPNDPTTLHFVTGVTTRPDGFQCKITPRSKEALALIGSLDMFE